jgi:hypothetical protein
MRQLLIFTFHSLLATLYPVEVVFKDDGCGNAVKRGISAMPIPERVTADFGVDLFGVVS